MTKTNPWGEIEIPKALEKEHKKEMKEKRKQRIANQWFREMYNQMADKYRNPRKELAEKGYTVVDDKDQLVDVLQSILNKGGPVDIIYEEPEDEKDLS